MTKWEYKTHTYCPYRGECLTVMPVDRRPLREILAALGEEGWEFVMKEKVRQCPGGGAHEELTFKRPVEEQPIQFDDGLMMVRGRLRYDPS